MAQTGYTPIQLYYSSTTTNAPTAGNLASGELAINITDGKLFYKDNGGVVQVIAWKTTPTTAGGTGLTSWTAGDLPYYATGTTLSKLGIGTAGQVLTSTGTAPQWSTLSGVAVTTFSAGTTGFTPSSATSGAVTLAGTLATTNGGTGLTSFTANRVFYASSTSAIGQSANLTFDGTTLTAANFTDSSLTSGRVTYATTGGNLTDSANLTFDGTNFVLGSAGAIRTSNASGYFETQLSYYLNAGGGGGFQLKGLGSGVAGIKFMDAADSTELMRLNTTGLGIGTSSPAAKLQVAGAGWFGSTTSQTTGTAAIYNDGNDVTIEAFAGNNTATKRNLLLATYGGNVGIGTSSPGARLDIGSGNLTFSSTAQRITGDFSNATLSNRLAFQTSTTNGSTIVNAITNGTGTTTAFQANNSADVANATFTRILTNNTEGRLELGINGTGSYLPLVFINGGAERMRLDSSGNLGLGTATPNTWSTGDSRISTVQGTGDTAINIVNGSGNVGLIAFGSSTVKRAAVLTDSSANLVFYTNATNSGTTLTGRMTIDAAGNLGLGVTPSAWGSGFKALQISSTSISNNGANDSFFGANYFFDGTNNRYINTDFAAAYGQIDGQHRWYTAASGTAGNIITFTQAMTLDASGNLGLGTTSPTGDGTAFQINGSSYATLHLTNSTTGATVADGFDIVMDGSEALLRNREAAAMRFATSSTERARITSGGNVEVNSASSGAGWSGTATRRISVLGGGYAASNSAALTLSGGQGDNNTASGWEIRSTASGATGSLVNTLTFNVTSYTGSADAISEKARITSGGDFLIGTTTSQDPLTVNGGATLNGGLDFSTSGTKNWQVVGNATDFYIGDQTLTRYAQLQGITTFTAWTFVSDRRLKHQIKDLHYGLDSLMQIRPREFNFIKDDQFSIGFIAQELKEVIPEAVTGNEIEFADNDSPEERASKTMGVSKEMLIPVLVKAIQEQQAIITDLRARVAQLEAK